LERGSALITGGAGRLGREIALSLADMGFDILLHFQSSKKDADELRIIIENRGSRCWIIKCDFSDIDQLKKMAGEVFNIHPECNLLINNASLFERASMMETDLALLDVHFNVNFRAPFLLSIEFAKRCKQGQIINILDTAIKRPLTKYFAYTISKKALYEFTKIAAVELGPDIRVNGICPGLIIESDGEDFEKLSRRVPLKRSGTIGNVISAIRFLIENDFITGESIFIDGGGHLK